MQVDPQVLAKSTKRGQLEGWLNKLVRIRISDGRTLVGAFMCTDRDRNIILGSCQEFVGDPSKLTINPFTPKFKKYFLWPNLLNRNV